MAVLFRWVTLVVIALAASCGGGGDSGVGTAVTGSALRARVAPSSCGYEHVYVTVEKIAVEQAAGSTEVTLPTPRQIDLMGLSGGVLAAVGAAPLQAGHYTQVRLVLAANSADVMGNAVLPAGGTPAPLSTPGAQQSGLKLQAQFDVAAGQSADLLLNFDPCQSVTRAGNSGQYLLSPVLAVQPLDVTLVTKGEFRVNTTAAGLQGAPDVARLRDGGYVIAWLEQGLQQRTPAILAQRYAANGSPVGGETRVDTTYADQTYTDDPAVAALSDGGYVITWSVQHSNFSRAYPIYARRFAADGTPMGVEQPVNSVSGFEQFQSDVAGLADGGYVVAWIRIQNGWYDVFARRYTAAGAASGPEQQVSTAGSALHPAVAALVDGGYVITWSEGDVHARRFTAAGATAGPQMLVRAGNGAMETTATALADGGYVIAWRISDGNAWFVEFQRYAPNDAALGAVTRPDPATVDEGAPPCDALGCTYPIQTHPSVAALADGGFIVNWTAYHRTPDAWDVYARRYAAGGAAVGSITRINVNTTDDQAESRAAAAGAGGLVVTWMSFNPIDSWDVYARQFDAQSLP